MQAGEKFVRLRLCAVPRMLENLKRKDVSNGRASLVRSRWIGVEGFLTSAGTWENK